MSLSDPVPWLLVLAAAHLGFQLTVDLVVYPALGEVGDEAWSHAHERHSARITPVVALLYPPLVAVLVWTAASYGTEPGTWVAVAGFGVAVLTTGAVAAPTHGRLGTAPPEERRTLLRRLDRADRVRTLGAVTCLAGALVLVAS